MSNKTLHAKKRVVIAQASVPQPAIQVPPPRLNAVAGGRQRIVPPQAPAHNWIPHDPTTQALLRGARI